MIKREKTERLDLIVVLQVVFRYEQKKQGREGEIYEDVLPVGAVGMAGNPGRCHRSRKEGRAGGRVLWQPPAVRAPPLANALSFVPVQHFMSVFQLQPELQSSDRRSCCTTAELLLWVTGKRVYDSKTAS